MGTSRDLSAVVRVRLGASLRCDPSHPAAAKLVVCSLLIAAIGVAAGVAAQYAVSSNSIALLRRELTEHSHAGVPDLQSFGEMQLIGESASHGVRANRADGKSSVYAEFALGATKATAYSPDAQISRKRTCYTVDVRGPLQVSVDKSRKIDDVALSVSIEVLEATPPRVVVTSVELNESSKSVINGVEVTAAFAKISDHLEDALDRAVAQKATNNE